MSFHSEMSCTKKSHPPKNKNTKKEKKKKGNIFPSSDLVLQNILLEDYNHLWPNLLRNVCRKEDIFWNNIALYDTIYFKRSGAKTSLPKSHVQEDPIHTPPVPRSLLEARSNKGLFMNARHPL